MTQQEVIAKILEEMSDKANTAHKLASDYALEVVDGKLEDRKMNEDTAKRYIAKYNAWKDAISIVSKYDSQR
jgi:hypothetical protein